jgi:predicted alpha/beta superfamily hydrolase
LQDRLDKNANQTATGSRQPEYFNLLDLILENCSDLQPADSPQSPEIQYPSASPELAHDLLLHGAGVKPMRADPRRVLVNVTFDITVPENTPMDAQVFVSGSVAVLGRWSAAGLRAERVDEHRYVARADLAVGTQVEFKITRGAWSNCETSSSGQHRPNRTRLVRRGETYRVIVPTWADSTHRARGPQGLNVQHRVMSSYLEGARQVMVHLPPVYDADDWRAYPLVIMHDGQNLFDDATSCAGVKWGVDEAVDRLVREGAMEPVIICGVWNSPARMQEYHPDHPRAERYLHFLTDELLPFLREHYRIQPGPTGIAGSSMGGIISLHFAERRRDLFTRVGAISPSLWASPRLIGRLEEFPLDADGRSLWLDMGTSEGQPVTWEALRKLREILVRNGWADQLHYREVAGARHQEWFWAERLPEILRSLYPPRLVALEGGRDEDLVLVTELQAA